MSDRLARRENDHYFNPRSPHGERHRPHTVYTLSKSFQPTLPARGATSLGFFVEFMRFHFNPRSPHGERRNAWALCHRDGWNFNPRSPHGERQKPT